MHEQRQFGFLGIALALFSLGLAQQAVAQIAQAEAEYTGSDRVENWTGKTILVVAPHPDDDTFAVGGTLALLAGAGNDVHVLLYTNDNAGSRDPSMTRGRLAAIRESEEQEACRILGIPIENITWLGVDDGMLEYADPRQLVMRVVREIRRLRPDAVFSIDPGAPFEQWHKSDHRAAALWTVDAMRAAAWRLYFPELEAQGLRAWTVPVAFLYYSAQPNYSVDISSVAEKKARAAAAHTSQFGAMVDHYDPDGLAVRRAALAEMLENSPEVIRERGVIVEKFRRSTRYGE